MHQRMEPFSIENTSSRRVSGLQRRPSTAVDSQQHADTLPGGLRTTLEQIAGFDLSSVRVHHNSPVAAQFHALASTQGNNIYLGPGQDGLLAHEAWHVVQQRQQRVPATGHLGSHSINADSRLEAEADEMAQQLANPLAEATVPADADEARSSVSPLTSTASNQPVQFRKAQSRNQNPRTFVLPQAARDHIFTNQNDGVGFHSIARNRNNLLPHVAQTDQHNRHTEPYRANHLGNNNNVVAEGKSMFPDQWTEVDVVNTVQRALTSSTIPVAEQVRINQQGTTEPNNRPLPPIVGGRVRGRANGIRVEGIVANGGILQTAYPLV